MKPPSIGLLTTTSVPASLPRTTSSLTRSHDVFTFSLRFGPPRRRFSSPRFWCSSEDPGAKTTSSHNSSLNGDIVKLDPPQPGNNLLNFEVRSPVIPVNFISAKKLSLIDQAFFLVTFIACTTSVAFTSFVVAAVPTLLAMRRAAISLSKLADTARWELPSTMAAIRLSGMEISDLTLELSDLSQEIADGVNKSAQAVQAAEAGVRQIGSLARQQTVCKNVVPIFVAVRKAMIEERASLPIISIQPVVAGAAKKTSRAVGQATKTLLNIISTSRAAAAAGEDGNPIDRIES